MNAAVVTVLALAAGTYALKAAGPLLLGRRQMPPAVERVANLTPAALLAALVVTSAAASGQRVVLDARLPAVLVAGLLLWVRAPFVVVVLGAAATAALVRLIL